jgi:hypothetical protein
VPVVAIHEQFCAHHSKLAAEFGDEAAATGDYHKRRNARERVPVIAESAPLERTSRSSR